MKLLTTLCMFSKPPFALISYLWRHLSTIVVSFLSASNLVKPSKTFDVRKNHLVREFRFYLFKLLYQKQCRDTCLSHLMVSLSNCLMHDYGFRNSRKLRFNLYRCVRTTISGNLNRTINLVVVSLVSNLIISTETSIVFTGFFPDMKLVITGGMWL